MKDISPEKRRLKELRFTVYVTPQGYIIHDSKKKVVAKNSSSSTSDEYESILRHTIDALQQVQGKNDPKDLAHVKIIVTSDNIYINNIIKEWLQQWKYDQYANRPHQSLLQQLYAQTQILNVDSLRVNIEECSYLQLIK